MDTPPCGCPSLIPLLHNANDAERGSPAMGETVAFIRQVRVNLNWFGAPYRKHSAAVRMRTAV